MSSLAVLFDSAHIDRTKSSRFGLGIYKPPADVPTPHPRPRFSGPSPIDSAWWLGFELGVSGERAEPPSRWPIAEREAFREANRDGLDQLWAEMNEAFAEPDPAYDECPCGCGRPIRWDWNDFVAAGIPLPNCAYLQPE